MTALMRLAFVCDRWLTPSQPWTINPRTSFLETRVPLTWTGVRPYRRPSDGKIVRVLHREEQFLSPGFLAQLRRLPGANGHPPDETNVVADNASRFMTGWAGSPIEIETIDGYRCPVGDGVVCDPATIRAIQAGAVETSLGYMPLWVSPPDDEMTMDPMTGAPCGVWQGPKGPEYYDLEHIVDPDCELVRDLVAKGFDASKLGPNHLAFALRAGRGGVQSRLQRAADGEDHMLMAARDGIDIDPSNPTHPLAVHDATWVSNPSRDLPIVEGEWDGDAAAASVFAWAGFDDESPDPARARQAFLAYDSDAPELKGSYKLPIARYRDGRLEVVSGGLQAAASYLPQTDIPEDVRKRARDTLDFYFAKLHEQQGQPAPASDRADTNARTVLPASKRTPKMPTPDTTKIQTRFASPALVAMAKGLGVELRPFTVTAARDEIDPDDALMFLEGIEKMCAAMREKMAGMEDQAETMKVDKAALEEAVKMKEAELEKAKAELATTGDMMKKACDSAIAERDAAVKERDALRIEVAPLRTAEITRLREQAVKLGVAKDAADKLADATEIKRAAILVRTPDAQREVVQGLAADSVDATYAVLSTVAPAPSQPATPGTAPMPKITQPSTPARDAGERSVSNDFANVRARLSGNVPAGN